MERGRENGQDGVVTKVKCGNELFLEAVDVTRLMQAVHLTYHWGFLHKRARSGVRGHSGNIGRKESVSGRVGRSKKSLRHLLSETNPGCGRKTAPAKKGPSIQLEV